MLVSFTPSRQPQFKAKAIKNPDEAAQYMDKIFKNKDIADLLETIRLTRQQEPVLADSLTTSARTLNLIS